MCRSKALRCWSAVLMCCSQSAVASTNGHEHSQGSIQPALQAPAHQYCRCTAATSDSLCCKQSSLDGFCQLLSKARRHSRHPQPSAQASPQQLCRCQHRGLNPTLLREACEEWRYCTYLLALGNDCIHFLHSSCHCGRLQPLPCRCRQQTSLFGMANYSRGTFLLSSSSCLAAY